MLQYNGNTHPKLQKCTYASYRSQSSCFYDISVLGSFQVKLVFSFHLIIKRNHVIRVLAFFFISLRYKEQGSESSNL